MSTICIGPRTHPVSALGTPLSPSATRVMLLGAGELGKEVTIALQRFGVEVIAVDRYPNAPAMQVAHHSHVIDMTDGAALRRLVEEGNCSLEANDLGAVSLAREKQLPFVCGPHLNIYNESALAYFAGLGAKLVATSPTYGWRGPVQVRETIRSEWNRFYAMAERAVAVGYEKAVAAVTITP